VTGLLKYASTLPLSTTTSVADGPNGGVRNVGVVALREQTHDRRSARRLPKPGTHDLRVRTALRADGGTTMEEATKGRKHSRKSTQGEGA
jgi:hypothetical protein